MKKLINVFVAVALFIAVAAPMQSAYAEKPDQNVNQNMKPGWGWGDKNHVHSGPPGLSVKNETNISLSNVFNIIAEAGAHVTVNVYQTVVNNLFGDNKS